jgi:hypothetical protein
VPLGLRVAPEAEPVLDRAEHRARPRPEGGSRGAGPCGAGPRGAGPRGVGSGRGPLGLVGDRHPEELLEAPHLPLTDLPIARIGGVEDVDDLAREVTGEHLEGDVGLGHLVVLVADDALRDVAGAAERVDPLDQRAARRQEHLQPAALVRGLDEHL